jgi:uncharacterized protein YbjT (DUF2867 family)
MKQGKTRVLVTGATGFLGRRLVETVVKRGYWVRGLDRSLAQTPIRKTGGAELIYGDVGNAGSLIPAFHDIDVVGDRKGDRQSMLDSRVLRA